MNVNLGIWGKLTRVVIFLLLLAGLSFIVVLYLPLIQQNERTRRQIVNLDDQIRREEQASRELKSQIDALQRDPKTVERSARERLGYAKPGETVIRFGETGSAASASR
jgi:cell division protein FtsB